MRSASERRELLKTVYDEARECTSCPLCETRTTVVFGAGNADADLMFIGEAPGANEDRMGLPFVGQAGKLLDRLLGEIAMDRKDVFIANCLKCRPPDNRDPYPHELSACQHYLFAQVELIEPVGDLHARQLLDEASARRRDRDLAAPRPTRGARGRAASGPPVPALPPRGGSLHAVDARGPARRLPPDPGLAEVRPARPTYADRSNSGA